MAQSETPNSPSVAPATPSGNSQDGQQGQGQQPQTPQTPQQPQPPKEINTVMVCKIGLETVQEIVTRTHEIFNYLKAIQPPFGSQNADKTYLEKQHRLNEVLVGITQHFKRLRVCWDKANVR